MSQIGRLPALVSESLGEDWEYDQTETIRTQHEGDECRLAFGKILREKAEAGWDVLEEPTVYSLGDGKYRFTVKLTRENRQ